MKSLLIGLMLTAPLLAQPRLVEAAGPFLQFWQKYQYEPIEEQRQAFQGEVIPALRRIRQAVDEIQ